MRTIITSLALTAALATTPLAFAQINILDKEVTMINGTGTPVLNGPLGSFVPESQFDTPLDYEAFAANWAVLGHGGVVVFDDYGWKLFEKQKIAEDDFMRGRGYEILELPTGQGLVTKR